MLRNVINKFGIYAMLSVFVILFSSCDDSTSANKENSALKKDIFKGWKVNRTCVEYNDLGLITFKYGHINKVGDTDSMFMDFLKIDSLEDMIDTRFYMGTDFIFTTAAWISSKAYSFPHWVIYHRADFTMPSTNIDIEIEITGINPLKGTWTERVYDSSFAEPKVFRRIELTGEEYKYNPNTTNMKAGQ